MVRFLEVWTLKAHLIHSFFGEECSAFWVTQALTWKLSNISRQEMCTTLLSCKMVDGCSTWNVTNYLTCFQMQYNNLEEVYNSWVELNRTELELSAQSQLNLPQFTGKITGNAHFKSWPCGCSLCYCSNIIQHGQSKSDSIFWLSVPEIILLCGFLSFKFFLTAKYIIFS